MINVATILAISCVLFMPIIRGTGVNTVWAYLRDPKSDIAFKHVFGTYGNEYITTQFLNDVFHYVGVDKITDLNIENTEMNSGLKGTFIDVMCTFANGTKGVVEMKHEEFRGAVGRSVHYACDALARQVVGFTEDCDVKPVIFVAIVSGDEIFPTETECLTRHNFRSTCSNAHLIKDVQWIFFELSKCCISEDYQPLTEIEKWCYFFKYAHTVEKEQFEKKVVRNEIICRAYDQLDKLYWSYQEKMMDMEIIMLEDKMRQNLNAAEKKGKIEMAKKLLKKGISVGIIAETAGLTVDEVENLS